MPVTGDEPTLVRSSKSGCRACRSNKFDKTELQDFNKNLTNDEAGNASMLIPKLFAANKYTRTSSILRTCTIRNSVSRGKGRFCVRISISSMTYCLCTPKKEKQLSVGISAQSHAIKNRHKVPAVAFASKSKQLPRHPAHQDPDSSFPTKKRSASNSVSGNCDQYSLRHTEPPTYIEKLS